MKDEDNFLSYFVQDEEIFKPYLNDHDSFFQAGETTKKSSNSHVTPEILLKKISHRDKVQEKKIDEKSEGSGVVRKRKEKVKTALSLLNPKTISKFCFLRMPEICKVMPCIKYFAGERPRSA